MAQTNLNNWEVVAAQINKQKRYNWAAMLGVTLTERITEHRLKGYGSEQIFKMIKSELLHKGYDEIEIFRKLKISVAARCGEQKAHTNRLKKTRGKI